ncbi:hypothetical protein QIS99_00440 [Streptomyces sp. B-S-A8]|uniref:Uncharacterized protein n=1 Tax=Streptomyces solicavernae TaxID=3043614 RepID=A0ABT6RJV6_9ACTN|nr:hypothetical protein [Streptomyces sp. B-S-A8]MDI3384696.1 hypothetical protein [Streptomyces sp. B-S-A8]
MKAACLLARGTGQKVDAREGLVEPAGFHLALTVTDRHKALETVDALQAVNLQGDAVTRSVRRDVIRPEGDGRAA